MEFCLTQWPEKCNLSEKVRPYFGVAQEMSIADGLLLRGNRMIIPQSLRKDILAKIHTNHMGIVKCRERARQAVWWPGLAKQLEELVRNCEECRKAQDQGVDPLCPSVLPDLPFQKVGRDLFEWDKRVYLLIVDYYSRFIEIAKLAGTTAAEVINHTKSIFARHGIPEVVISDNGPQFSLAAYALFSKEYGFTHATSSPLYPRGNGEAERAVKTIKRLLRKRGDPYQALLAYCSTPLECGYSPSELLMSRKLQTTIPTTRNSLTPTVPNQTKLREKDKKLKHHQERNYNHHHRARSLRQLSEGSRVWVPDQDSEAEVIEETSTRSYQVANPEGVYRRNRTALRPLPAQERDGEDLHLEPAMSDIPQSNNPQQQRSEPDPNGVAPPHDVVRCSG